MSAFMTSNSEDSRRTGVSPRPKGRENAKDTLCRNVTIYGHCRYEDKGCAFNHDPIKSQPSQSQTESVKKRFNVDSPSFTPSSLTVNGARPLSKTPGISPKMANAAPFKPRAVTPAPAATSSSASSSKKGYNPNAPDWIAPGAQEFLPQSYNSAHNNMEYPSTTQFDESYMDHTPAPSNSHSLNMHQNSNVYTQDANGYGQAYFPNSSSHTQMLNHHLYAPLDPYREPTKPNQRTVKDFFIPEDLRKRLHNKNEAALRTFANSTLPRIGPFHTLTPLQGTTQANQSLIGHTNTVYKAISSDDGKMYCLRRFHDLTVTTENENAIQSIRANWPRVSNSSVVSVHFAMSTKEFRDTSVIVVSDYHPASTTVAETYLNKHSIRTNRNASNQDLEDILWHFLVQIANALRAVHSANLAARVIDATKVLLTDENRIRLNGCAIDDVLDRNTHNIQDLQRQDLEKLGKFIVTVGANSIFNPSVRGRAMDALPRLYSERLRNVVDWLLSSAHPEKGNTIHQLIDIIASNTMDAFNATLRLDDQLQSTLNRELENGRLIRLMSKLNLLNERPEYEHDPTWSPVGPLAILVLFRDYVFHPVDSQGNPVVDMGRMLACLNKLDVGVEEKIQLITRDSETLVVVSYKELKAAFEKAWQELMRRTVS